ncbi:MAG: S8 family serine peptidase [Anaerolineae bacterium]|nr:S8 family serine peptidase [Anaerolineae bacterium]
MSKRERGILLILSGLVILVVVLVVLRFAGPQGPDSQSGPSSEIVVQPTLPPDVAAEPTSVGFIPNDPEFPRQWYLPAIGAPQAWETIPSDRAQVVVAVVDTGICTENPDLAGRISGGMDFINETSYRELIGFDGVGNRFLPADDRIPPMEDTSDHGCAMANVIAAITNNGVGMAGIAPNAVIMPIKVLAAGGQGTVENIAAGITYAVDNGADIINLSISLNPGSSDAEIEAITSAVSYAVERGIPVIASAGNTAGGNATLPASLDGVIAVGSLGPDMQPDPLSAAQGIDVWAPGEQIVSASMGILTGRPSYEEFGGASIAAAVVSGVLAATGQIPIQEVNGLPILRMNAAS